MRTAGRRRCWARCRSRLRRARRRRRRAMRRRTCRGRSPTPGTAPCSTPRATRSRSRRPRSWRPARLHRPPPRPGLGPGGALGLRAEAVGGARRPEVERGRPDLRQRGADRLARRPGPAARAPACSVSTRRSAPRSRSVASAAAPSDRTAAVPGRPRRCSAPSSREAMLTPLRVTEKQGEDYIDECAAAGVPIPPTWGTSGWESRGSRTRCSSRATPRCSSSKRRRRRARGLHGPPEVCRRR